MCFLEKAEIAGERHNEHIFETECKTISREDKASLKLSKTQMTGSGMENRERN